MTTHARALQWILLAALTASTIACGGSMSATGPSRPGSGAVITGRVNLSGGAASTVAATAPLALSVSPLALALSTGAVPMAGASTGALTVTIVGTNVSTTIDGSGTFTLDNVPPGTVQLHFQGRGADAILTISGVEADDHLQITVTLNGHDARLDSRSGGGNGRGVEVNGRIDSIDGGARSLRVGSQTVLVQTSTVIRHGNKTFAFGDLRVGDHIQVKGTRDGSTVTASEIKVETEDGEDEDEDDDNEVAGAISGLTGTCPALSFVVAGTKVATNASTRFEDGACGTLANNVRVEVTGTRAGDGTLVATKVERD